MKFYYQSIRKMFVPLFTDNITMQINFLDYLSEFLEYFSRYNHDIYLMGDFNRDLIKYEICKYSQTFLLCIQSYFMLPTIDKPTRVYSISATFIDNICTNDLKNNISSGNIVTYTTDHFSQVCKLPNTKKRLNSGIIPAFMLINL